MHAVVGEAFGAFKEIKLAGIKNLYLIQEGIDFSQLFLLFGAVLVKDQSIRSKVKEALS